LLTRVFSVIERDAPRCAATLADRMAGIAIVIKLDGERAVVRSVPGGVVVGREFAPGVPVLEVAAGSRTILALLSGFDRLYPAVYANRVCIRGARKHIACVFDILTLVVEGCARSTEGPRLLAELRELSERNQNG